MRLCGRLTPCTMNFFECFLGQDANKTSCLIEGFNNIASWDIFGEVPCLPVSQVHPLEKNNKFPVSRLQNGPSHRRTARFRMMAVTGMMLLRYLGWLGLPHWLMVGKKIYNEKNWPRVFLGRHFPFSTCICICTICTCIPKVYHWVFVESKESQDHSKFEFGGWWNLELTHQSWCVQGYFDDTKM